MPDSPPDDAAPDRPATLHDVLDAILDGITGARAVRARDGRIEDFEITFMNRVALESAGHTEDDIVGRRMRDVFPGIEALPIWQAWVRCTEHGEPFERQAMRYRRGEVDAHFDVRGIPVDDGFLAAWHDVSERQLLVDALAARTVQLEWRTAQLESRTTELTRSQRQTWRARERLSRERDAVSVLQDVILSTDVPVIPGLSVAHRYRAAEQELRLGGDWFDAFEMRDGRLLTSIGDVSGHGVLAARLMAKLRHALRAYASLSTDLVTMLERLDQFLHDVRPGGDDFATVLIAAIDPVDGTVEIASAGHPPPLIVDRDGPRMVDVVTTGPVGLGHALGFRPTVTRLVMNDGDCLMLYTDGLIERPGESFDASLEMLIASVEHTPLTDMEAWCDHTLGACLPHGALRDDVCLLTVCRSAD